MLKRPSNIPKEPGIYQFLDKKGKPLYIGKAINLRSRLASYSRKEGLDKRIRLMIEQAKTLKWQKTNSDIEALILESILIKKKKPKYNILMRDDKSYQYICITKETWPKIYIVHDPNKVKKYLSNKKSEYMGPFTDGPSLRSTMRMLQKTLPYCTCKSEHTRYCLNYHINKCFGDCCLKSSENKKAKEYKKNIRIIKNILTGKKDSIIKSLTKSMQSASTNDNFDHAIELRNQIYGLERVFRNAKVVSSIENRDIVVSQLKKHFNLPSIPYRIEGYDISNVQGKHATGSMVVFEQGQPNKSEYRIFNIKTKDSPDDTAMLREILERRMRHSEWAMPDLILIDGGKAQLNTALSIKMSAISSIPILALAKGPDRKGKEIFSTTRTKPVQFKSLTLDTQSLIKYIDSEAHRFAINHYRKIHRRSIVK